MNYLAHGYRFLSDPLFLAGTAVPDWLSVVNRKVRARRRLVIPVVQSTDSKEVDRIGHGILQHHKDDDLFHRSEIFMQLESELGLEFRRYMPDRFDHRPGFLGHIVVELMLDASIVADDPHILDQFYAAMDLVNEETVQSVVNQMVTRTTDRLAWFIRRFREVRFLYDYRRNDRMFLRLNQVLSRVKLPAMHAECLKVLPIARELLSERGPELLQTVAGPGD